MKTFACVLVALLSTALAAPLEENDSSDDSGHPIFQRPLFFNHRGLSTSTLAPTEETKDDASTVIPSEETPTRNDDDLSVSGLNPAMTGAEEGRTEDTHMEQAEDDHSHMDDSDRKEDDKQENNQHPEIDQHDEQPSASEDSYSRIKPDDSPKDDTSMETKTETPETNNEPGDISRDLKPPHEESSWGDFKPIVEEQDEVANVDNSSKTGGDETRVDDAINKKPTDTGNDMLNKDFKGGRYTPRWLTT